MVRLNFPSARNDSGKPMGIGGKLGISLFFLFFFAMGSLFEVFIIREFGRAAGQRSWKKVPCTIVRSDVEERNDSEEPFAFVVSFEYEYGGRSRTGGAYKRSYTASDTYTKAQRLAQRYRPGLETSCYVNPKNPSEAVLKQESLLIGLVVLFPMIFVAIGAGGIYFTWRRRPAPGAEPIAAADAGSILGRCKGKYGLVAFFAIFAVVGLAIAYPLGVVPISKTISAGSWVATPCKVLRADVRSHDSDDGTTYSIYILYRYEFNGRTYKCDRYDFVGGSSSGYRGKARVAAEYEANPDSVCYVNPQNPAEATLKRGWHAKLLFALFPLPFILVGVGGIVFALRGKSGEKGPRVRAWMPKTPTSEPQDVSVLRPGGGGTAVLRPKHSPATKLAGAIFIAAFLNGIVSIFVFSVISDLRGGEFDLFKTLFLLPFVAIGLGLVALVVYQVMAMFNPRPTLERSTTTIPLGGVAELRWSFTGQAQRINEFTVTLRGTEHATYRRGTNTYTDKNVFHEMELYKTSITTEIGSGQVGLIVPSDTMHSFEADNNKIIWNLEIHGDIKKWPDVKESFKVSVVPAVA
jgi:hypothetical protein